MSLFHQAERWQQMWEHPGAQRGPGRSLQLADPPAITELLRGEVQMLLLTLRERSSAGGWYVDTCTRAHPLICLGGQNVRGMREIDVRQVAFGER